MGRASAGSDSLRRAVAMTRDTARVQARLQLSKALFGVDNEQSRRQLDSARSEAVALGYREGESQALVSLAWSDYYLGNYLAGMENARRCFTLLDTLRQSEATLRAYTIMGVMHQALEAPDSARAYMLRALATARRIANHERISRSLNNIGVTYYYQSRFAESLPWFLQSYDYLQKHPVAQTQTFPHFEVTVLLNIGEAYVALRESKRGMDYIRRAEELAARVGDTMSLGGACYSLAKGYDSTGNYQAAIRAAERGLVIHRTHRFRLREKDLAKLLSTLYERIGDYRSSLRYLRFSNALADSLRVEETKRKLADLAAFSKLRDQEIAISRLREESAAAGSRAVVAFALSALLLVGGGVLWFTYRQKTRTARVLAAKNQEVEAVNQSLRQTLEELRATQEQLVISEKAAALGRFVSHIAHEFNTPLSAIRSGSQQLQRTVSELAETLGPVLRALSDESFASFRRLIARAIEGSAELTTREERHYRRSLEESLRSHGISKPEKLAGQLVSLGLPADLSDWRDLLIRPDAAEVLKAASHVAQVIESTKTVRAASERTRRIVSALSFFARPETLSSSPQVPAPDAVKAALASYELQLRGGLNLVTDLRWPDPLPRVPASFEMVLSQLLHNAILATAGKGNIRLSAHAENGHLAVSVGDDGTGIDPEVKARLFEPFFTTRPKGEGIGLGLYVAKQLVTQAGGDIRVSSRPGDTVFTVTLPLRSTAG